MQRGGNLVRFLSLLFVGEPIIDLFQGLHWCILLYYEVVEPHCIALYLGHFHEAIRGSVPQLFYSIKHYFEIILAHCMGIERKCRSKGTTHSEWGGFSSDPNNR